MKILVCIKQVPDMESRFKIGAAGTWYDTSDLAWRLNEYDEYAVEQAVQVKEQQGGAPEITVLSVGPERVKEAIKKALAMGCDRGVHIQDEASHEKDPFEIASIIAEYAQQEAFDLILTGMQSQDRGSAQVGVLLAEMLGIPAVTTIVGFALEGTAVTAKRELEGGMISDERLMNHALSGTQPEPPGFAPGKFQHRECRFLAANGVARMRRGLFDDLLDESVRVDEHHVERDVGVHHPHPDWPRAFVHKQHAAHRGEGPDEHEALGLAPRVVREPDLEDVFHLLAVGDLELAARKCGQIFGGAGLGPGRGAAGDGNTSGDQDQE
jgi:hypothetical protein